MSRENFPHDLADRDNTLVIMSTKENHKDAILVTATPGDGDESVDVSGPVHFDGLHVHAERRIFILSVSPDWSYIINTINKPALALREDELTDTHLGIFNQRSAPSTDSIDDNEGADSDEWTDIDEAFEASLDALEQKMQGQIASVIATDARFVDAVTAVKIDRLDHLWTLIQDWFHVDYVATVFEDDQVWFVD